MRKRKDFIQDYRDALARLIRNEGTIITGNYKINFDTVALEAKRKRGAIKGNTEEILALKHDIHSIAFPAISTGVYHYPLEEATKIAISTVKTWLDMHKDYKLDIIFSCFDEKTYNMYQRYLEA